MRRSIWFVALALTSSFACGGSSSSSPAAPTPAAAPRFKLTGVVSSSTLGILPGASVEVVDGPNRGQRATADSNGRYIFPALEQSGFTLRASAANHESSSVPVNLVAETTLDVVLTKIARADLVFGGDLTFTLQPGGRTWAMRGNGRNAGDGCAGNVTGSSTFVNPSGATIATLNWSLPSSMVIRPAATFTYDTCCLDVSAASAGGTYSTAATYSTIACP